METLKQWKTLGKAGHRILEKIMKSNEILLKLIIPIVSLVLPMAFRCFLFFRVSMSVYRWSGQFLLPTLRSIGLSQWRWRLLVLALQHWCTLTPVIQITPTPILLLMKCKECKETLKQVNETNSYYCISSNNKCSLSTKVIYKK